MQVEINWFSLKDTKQFMHTTKMWTSKTNNREKKERRESGRVFLYLRSTTVFIIDNSPISWNEKPGCFTGR